MRFLLLPLVLAGCATAPPQMAHQSNWQVCEYMMGSRYPHEAQQEAARRGLDCAPIFPAIAAQRQAENAATANFINSLNRPAAPRPAPPVSCRSWRVGNQVQTTCQ
jgi:starvation-inducible outer membrane lipoprotein